jgi:hypothetical protein
MSQGTNFDDTTTNYIAGGINNVRQEVGGPTSSDDFTLNGNRILTIASAATNSVRGGLKVRLSGTTLFISNTASNA